ncbi:hypothetical protein SDC9_147644 [bioreactor metagenome]|uniref:Uncharacterized protein n=1 Tax=bioreactor metagenome TaxID=1076179 RepID=A0A645EH17_9ZZZZ
MNRFGLFCRCFIRFQASIFFFQFFFRIFKSGYRVLISLHDIFHHIGPGDKIREIIRGEQYLKVTVIPVHVHDTETFFQFLFLFVLLFLQHGDLRLTVCHTGVQISDLAVDGIDGRI